MSDSTADTTAGPVRLTGRLICASAAEADIVRAHLPDHIRLTREEPGCLSFDVVQTADPLVWSVDESFRDRRAFEDHQARTRASAWWTATAEIARRYEITGLGRAKPARKR